MRVKSPLTTLRRPRASPRSSKELQPVAAKLVGLTQKLNRAGKLVSPEALWRRILAHLDEIYTVVDAVQEHFGSAVAQVGLLGRASAPHRCRQ